MTKHCFPKKPVPPVINIDGFCEVYIISIKAAFKAVRVEALPSDYPADQCGHDLHGEELHHIGFCLPATGFQSEQQRAANLPRLNLQGWHPQRQLFASQIE